ncbi:MAG: hypothetical protein FWH27_00925 [Planctomycetaceae bacterium]|nr:hypothetical protein [Planctomycetaceae bacterium]
MKKSLILFVGMAVFAVVCVVIAGRSFAADVPLPPIGDLTPQIESYVNKLNEGIADLDGTKDYKADSDSLIKDASALMLVALAIGLSPEDSQYKKAVPAIIKACAGFKTAGTYAEAKAAVAGIAQATQESGDSSTLSWSKIVALKPAMKAVPVVNSGVSRNMRNELTLKKGIARVCEGTATLAVIVHGSIANADETIKPAEAELWKKQCELFRDMALETNKMAHDFEAGNVSFGTLRSQYDKLNESCDACHEHFVGGGQVN